MLVRHAALALGLLLLPLPLALGGCGWEPVYANRKTAPADAELAAIKVLPIAERVGQRLEMALRDSFRSGDAAPPAKYLLRVTLSTSIGSSGIQSQGLGTRGEAAVSASYQLVDAPTLKVLQTGSVNANESFDIQANGYSTVVAQNDAFRRSVEQIRHEIVTRLTLFLQRKAMAGS